ncbi:hypothetical protein FA09DRAFT_244351 [Tilletiopsis washingtonensis]|uniref:Secreted protein n=1 Tax=Tilletiopsis washingtonensis TaxID=58919 RepID=A0A316ZCC5_9BASI|nr:hypothetical protein FA09DRAFT_244351 [Tilletiopsis washingtonensis]PWN99179.1 hypothetical protein FA09DRAFT_244351 [Tilletiopsis washingtonensis]
MRVMVTLPVCLSWAAAHKASCCKQDAGFSCRCMCLPVRCSLGPRCTVHPASRIRGAARPANEERRKSATRSVRRETRSRGLAGAPQLPSFLTLIRRRLGSCCFASHHSHPPCAPSFHILVRAPSSLVP